MQQSHMNDESKVETVVGALLSPTDRKRVEVYLRLIGTLGEITTVAAKLSEEYQAVLRDPNTTPEARVETERSYAETMRQVADVIARMDATEVEGKVPTPEMLRTYALVEVAKALDEMRDDVKTIKDGIERMTGW